MQGLLTALGLLPARRYCISHNGTILYFVIEDGQEYLVVLNKNGTCSCQHNGIAECAPGCMHEQHARLHEMRIAERAQKYQAEQDARHAREAERREHAPLNGNRAFQLMR